MSYALILIICILPLYVIHWAVDHKQRKIKSFFNINLNDLKDILEELSMEMNNQSLLIRNFNNENEVRILKYQNNGFWGMNIIIRANIFEEKEDQFNLLLNNIGTENVYDSEDNKVFDFGSDLSKVNSFVQSVFTVVFNIQSKANFIFIFERKRLEILKLNKNPDEYSY
jgi:phosphopantothenoylcysteine synthetase/decarboxylase